MSQDVPASRQQVGRLKLLLLGAIALATHACAIGTTIIAIGDTTNAQIIPDNSLGAERSILTPSGVQDAISGGAIRGTNLFHSFSEFNVLEGQQVYFVNPNNIANILTRVTGNNLSRIFGTLGVNGSANLFLLNPNGIIFGPNARLDLRGSFIASTASSAVFNEFEFSTINPETPPLLTINVPIGLRMGNNPGSITVQGTGNNLQAMMPVGTDFRNRPVGLLVEPNRTLGLIGGEIVVSGGNLTAPGGRIELGSVGSEASVKLNPSELGWAFDYTGISNFGDIRLEQAASAITISQGGGPVFLQGRRVTLKDGSVIHTSTAGAGAGGNLTIRGIEAVEISGGAPNGYISGLFADVLFKATGNAGNILIETPRFLVTDGAQISSGTLGQGNGGNLTVRAAELAEITGVSQTSISGLYTPVAPQATGKGGEILIETGRLLVTNGAQISSGTFGQGNAGNLIVRAAEVVEISGGSQRSRTGLFAPVAPQATGKGGDILIETPRLLVTGGAAIVADTAGLGNGGSITVRSSDTVAISGISANGVSPSGLFAATNPGATGNAGDILVETPRLQLTEGGQIGAGTFSQGTGGSITVRSSDAVIVSGASFNEKFPSGLFTNVERLEATGNAGDILIETPRLQLTQGGTIATGTLGQGSGGNLTVRASDTVELSGTPGTSKFSTGLFTEVRPGATGNAGNMSIETRRLLVTEGAQIATGTSGRGSAGNLTVLAADGVELFGTSPNGRPSSLQAAVNSGATGNAGDILVETRLVQVTGGAQIATLTSGQGNAGDLTVRATDGVIVSGVSTVGGQFPSALFASVEAGGTGRGGSIAIATPRLQIENSARVNVTDASGTNGAGSILVNANSIRLNEQAAIEADTRAGEQGNITLNTDNIQLRRHSRITTNAQGTNVIGGNIIINTDVLAALENSDISANSADFRGGNVTVNAEAIFGTQFRQSPTLGSDITATGASSDLQGIVQINTPDVDPAAGLIELPENFTDPSRLIASGCPAQRGDRFVVAGRGGLPEDPRTTLRSVAIIQDLRLKSDRSVARESRIDKDSQPPMVEANGWVVNQEGNIQLTAVSSSVNGSFGNWPINCR